MNSSAKLSTVPSSDRESFSAYLQSSERILALCGAGLSAASGLPTFRGAGGIWRSEDATSLATPEAFNADPVKVWQFYSYRRHMALKAQPNRAHLALAELARRKEHFVTLTQNVDGLSPRANHPPSKLHLLHGSLFDNRCTNFYCDYSKENDFTDPIVPALAIPKKAIEPKPFEIDKTGARAAESLHQAMVRSEELDISDESIPIPKLNVRELPHCPKCRHGILRPGVVWFGEALPAKTLDAVNRWIDDSDKIDLIMVIGTSSRVYPAASYVDIARMKGARVAVINMDREDAPQSEFRENDWFFEGDAGEIVPDILKSVVGDI
ncbi:MAG: hypothetical protein M1834_008957 [Cirrosporium novae-zelandiae]|nr:MAG: hypothetical protein M1834_008957 [Cirrosporium novae-zelandiae]